MIVVRRTISVILVLALFVAAWYGLGFLIAVSHTNPPPPVPGRENMIEFSRYSIFGTVSFIVGMICAFAIHRAWKSFENLGSK